MKVTRTALPWYSRRLTGSPSELSSSSGAAGFGGEASAPANFPSALAPPPVVESDPLPPQPAATSIAQAKRRAGNGRRGELIFLRSILGGRSSATEDTGNDARGVHAAA